MATPSDVLAQLAEARAALDALAWDRQVTARGTEHLRASLLMDAQASAALEGAVVPAEVLAQGPPRAPLERLAARVLALHADVAGAVDLVSRAPLQVLARFGSIMSAGVLAPSEVGRPRTGPPEDPWHLQLAPPAPAVPGLLAQVVRPRGAGDAPALVTAGLVHAHLMVLAPFPTGNGPIARAFTTALLRSRGIDVDGRAPLSAGLREVGRPALVSALRAFAAEGPPPQVDDVTVLVRPGVAGWLRVWAAAVTAAAAVARAGGGAVGGGAGGAVGGGAGGAAGDPSSTGADAGAGHPR